MCVTSLLCGPRTDLWPFYGFLCKRFSLYIKPLYIEKTVYRKDVTHIFSKVSCFLLISFHFRRLTMPMLLFRAWATCDIFRKLTLGAPEHEKSLKSLISRVRFTWAWHSAHHSSKLAWTTTKLFWIPGAVLPRTKTCLLFSDWLQLLQTTDRNKDLKTRLELPRIQAWVTLFFL